MAKSNRPKRLLVGAKSYKIHWSAEAWANRPSEDNPDSAWGLTDHKRLGIWLNPVLEEQNKRETLLHEGLHCLFAATGGDVSTEALSHMSGTVEAEELIVSRIESQLFALLIHNPEVLKYITG